jgi:beta-glucanase (GH16 family)
MVSRHTVGPRAARALFAGALAAACSSSAAGPAGDEPSEAGSSSSGSSSSGSSSSGSSGSAHGGGDAATGDASIDAAARSDAPATSDAPSGSDAPPGGPSDAAIAGWTLSWSDEFNGADGSPADPSKWTHDVGGTGWGNQEREYYTDGAQNAVQQGGALVITATTSGASQYSCWYGTCRYTSARLLTKGAFAQAYGRFEARAQMPFGKGLWPAFWMLGDNIDTVSWPACGEIDILETIGTDISTNHGSLHAPSFNPTGTYTLPGGAKFSDAFHTFAVEWEPGTVRFYVDDQLYETRTSTQTDGGTWEFDHPFFLLLNVAVGGQWPGDPDSTTTFPQTLKVDWVRVYTKNGTEP